MEKIKLSLPNSGATESITDPSNQTQKDGVSLYMPKAGGQMPRTYRSDLDNIPSYFKIFAPGNLSMDLLQRQRAMAQSGWEQAGRAIAGGVSKGVMTAIEDLGYIGDIENNFSHLLGIDDLETNWLSSWAKENKEKLSERFQVYTEDPNKTFAWGDSGFYWSFLQEALTSAVGFGIPGLAAMGAARGALKFAQTYTGILSATSKANKAMKVASAYMMNVGEGKFMALETKDRTLRDLAPLVEKGEITLEEAELRANRAADRMFMLNRAMMLTDYMTVGGAMKGLGIGEPKQSVFKQMLKEAPREALEEIYQGTVDKTVSSLELQDAGVEQRKTLASTIVQSALDPNTLLEGLMGAVSGPIQMGVITKPQEAVSNWLSNSPAENTDTETEVDIENEISDTVKSHAKAHAKAEAAKAAGLNGLATVEIDREFLDQSFKALSKNEGYRIIRQLQAERENLEDQNGLEAEALNRLEELFNTAATAFDRYAGSPNQEGLISAEVSKVYALNAMKGIDTEIQNKSAEIVNFLNETGIEVNSLEEALENEDVAELVKDLENFELLENLQAHKKTAEKLVTEANKTIQELSKASNQKKARNERKAAIKKQEQVIEQLKEQVRQAEKKAEKEVVPPATEAAEAKNPDDILKAKKADIERRRQEELLGKSFTETTEKVVTGKGPSAGKTIVRFTESKISSDGEVLTIKPKAKFKNENTSLVALPETITVEEFKEQFYENLSEQDKEMFDEFFTDASTRIRLVEARIGLKGTAKGQVNIDVKSLDGQPFSFELQNGKEINAEYDKLKALKKPTSLAEISTPSTPTQQAVETKEENPSKTFAVSAEDSTTVIDEYTNSEIAAIVRNSNNKAEEFLGKLISKTEKTVEGGKAEQEVYEYGTIQRISTDDGSKIQRLVDNSGKARGIPLINLTMNAKEAGIFFDGKKDFSLTEKQITDFFNSKFAKPTQQAVPFGQNLEPGNVIYSIEDEDFDLDDILNNIQVDGKTVDEIVEEKQNTDREIADKTAVVEEGEVKVLPRRPSQEIAWKLEKTKVVNGKYVAEPQGLISDFKDNQITPQMEGQALTFVIDDNDNIPVYAPEWYTNVEAGLDADESQMTTWGELKKVLPEADMHNFVPIRIEADGKTLGYVHATEWVRTDDVAWNPALETEKLSSMRKAIVDKGGATGKVSFVSKGKLNLTGSPRPLIKDFADSEVVVYAPKEFDQGNSSPYFLTKDGKKTPKELGVTLPETMYPGRTYFIVDNNGTKELVYAKRRGLSPETIAGVQNAVRLWWKLGQSFAFSALSAEEKALYNGLKEQGIDLKKDSAIKDYLKPFLRNTSMKTSAGDFMPAEIFLQTSRQFRKDSGVVSYEKNFLAGGFGAGKEGDTLKSKKDIVQSVFKIHRKTTKSKKILDAELNKMGAVLGAMWHNVDSDVMGRLSPIPMVQGYDVNVVPNYDSYIKTSHTTSLKPIENEEGDKTYTRQHIIEFQLDDETPVGEVKERGQSLSPIEAYHLRTLQQVLFGPTVAKTPDSVWKEASEREFISILDEAEFWASRDAGMAEIISVYEKLRSYSPYEAYWGIDTPQARVAEAITGMKFSRGSFGSTIKLSDDDEYWITDKDGAPADEVFEALMTGDNLLADIDGRTDITEDHIRDVLNAQMSMTAYDKEVIAASKKLRSAYAGIFEALDQSYLPKKYRVSPRLTMQTIQRAKRLYGLDQPIESEDYYDSTPFSVEEEGELAPHVRTQIGSAIANNIISQVAVSNTVDKSEIASILDKIRAQVKEYVDEMEDGQIVLDNFNDIVENISMPYVEASGVIEAYYKTEEEEDAELEPEDTKSYDSLNSLTWNPSKTASQAVRKLLASIPTGDSIFGIPEYVDLDEAAGAVFALTAGNQDNFEGKIALLAAAKKSKPWLQSFINRLSDASEQVKKQFTIATNNVGQDMYTAMFTISKDGTTLELFHEGKFQKAQNILTDWDRNVQSAEGIVKTNNATYFTQEWLDILDKKYKLLITDYNNIVKQTVVLHKTNKEEAASFFNTSLTSVLSLQLRDFYSHMGIVISTDEAYDIWLTNMGHNQMLVKDDQELPSMLKAMTTAKKRKRNWITGTYAAVKEAVGQSVLLGQSLEASNPITSPAVTGMRNLAMRLADGSRLSSMQVQRVGGKNVPRFGMYSKMTEMAEKLVNSEEERKAARLDKRLVNNLILDTLDTEKGLEDFSISPHSLNALSQRYSKRESQDFVNMTPADQEAVRVIGFYESVSKPSPAKEIRSGDNVSRRMYVLTPTISDKARIMAITSYTLGSQFTNTPDGKLTEEGAREIARRMVVPEIIRAQQSTAHEDNIFYSFRKLNQTELRNDKAGLIDTTMVSNGELTAEAEQIVLPIIQEAINAQVEATKARWRALDVARLVPTSDEYSFDQAVLEYEVNTTVMNAAYYQIFKGDVAYSYKSSPAKSIDQQITDTYNNLHKRLAADSAPGLTPAFDNPNEEVQYAVLDDTKQVSNAIDSYKKLLSADEASEYEEIESADAQELVTLDEYLQLAYDQGRITKEDVTEIPKSLARSGTDIPKNIIGKLQVFKYVTTGIVQNPVTGERKEVYIKSSIMPLIPYVLGDSELGKLAKTMEEKGYKHVVYKSGLKLGSPKGIKKAFKVDGTLVDNLEDVLEAGAFTVPRRFLRLQQETPFKDKAYINRGTQETKLVFQGLFGRKDITYNYESVKDVDVDTLFEMDRQLLQNMFEDLHRQFLRKYLSKTGDILTSPEFLKLLKKEAMDRGYPAADLDNIEIVDGRMRVPIWGADSASRMYTLMNSLVNNNLLKLKMPGTSAVLGSDLGFTWKGLKEGTEAVDFIQNNKSRILFTENYDPEQGLKPQRRVKKDVYDSSKVEDYNVTAEDEKEGNVLVLPAQIMLPNIFFTNEGKVKLDLKQFVVDGKLDVSRIDPKLFRMMGFRIPTQGHSSMSYMEVVGVLPEEHGNLVIAPKDFTKQMGSDFDVDKLYIYRYNIYQTKDNKIVRYDDAIGRQDKKATIQNQYLDVRMAILSNPDKQIQRQILSPLGEEQWGNLADKYGKETMLEPNSAAYQQARVERAAAGSAGIGYFSQLLTLQPLLEKAYANKKTIRFFETDDEGITGLRTHKYAGYEFKAEFGMDSTVDGEGSRFKRMVGIQSASVDNENLQILHRIGVTPQSFNMVAGAIMSGASSELITLTLLQPAVQEKMREDKLQSAIIIRGKNKKAKKELPPPSEIQITKQMLEAALQGTPSPEIMEAIQNEALRAFDYFEGIGSKFNTVAKAVNIDSKKLPKLPFEAAVKLEDLKEIFSSSPALERAIYGYTTQTGKFVGASIFGIATHFGLNFVNDYFSKASLIDSPVFKDAVKNYMDISNYSGKEAAYKAAVKGYNTLRAMAYRLALPSDDEIKDLLSNKYDPETKEITHYSIGEIVQDMKRRGLENFGTSAEMYFLGQLTTLQETPTSTVDIKYENAAADLILGTQVKYSFESMLANNRVVGEYNGKEWTVRDVALALTKYSMGRGLTTTPTSFSKFITPAAKEAVGMTRAMYEMVEKQLRRGEVNNLLEEMILSDPSAIRDMGSITRLDKRRQDPVIIGEANARLDRIEVGNYEAAPAYMVGQYKEKYKVYKLVVEQNGKSYYEKFNHTVNLKSPTPYLYSAPRMNDVGQQFKRGNRDFTRELRTFTAEQINDLNKNKQAFKSGERIVNALILEAAASMAEAKRPAGRVSTQLLEKWSTVMPATIKLDTVPMAQGMRGFYNPANKTITINSSRVKADQAETVHHELLHVFTESVLDKTSTYYKDVQDVMNRVRSNYGITDEMVTKVMDNLYTNGKLSSRTLSNDEINELKSRIPSEFLNAKKGSVAAFVYALSSPEEFIAHALTDETMMRATDAVDAKKGFSIKDTLIKLMSILRRVLMQLKGDRATALDELIFYLDQAAQIGTVKIGKNGSGLLFSQDELSLIEEAKQRCE